MTFQLLTVKLYKKGEGMSRKKGKVDFEKRKLLVLKSIVMEYLQRGEPVSSRVIARKYGFNLSPATIRNIMMDLEEEGFLYQPHTSAGRIPTISGLKIYVEDLVRNPDGSGIVEELREKIGRLPPGETRLLPVTTHLLSEVTHYTALAVADLVEDLRFKSVTLVPENGNVILAVLVFSGGIIKSVVVENKYGIDRETLIRIGNYLTETFSGMNLHEIEKTVRKSIADVKRELMKLAFQIYLEIAEQYFGSMTFTPEVFINGTLNIMEYPEFASSEKVKRLLELLQEKETIERILVEARNRKGVAVIMGEELGVEDLQAAFVAGSFSGAGRGVIGIVGPLRMDYRSIIPAIKFVAERMSGVD